MQTDACLLSFAVVCPMLARTLARPDDAKAARSAVHGE
jgi:hypothetical protein